LVSVAFQCTQKRRCLVSFRHVLWVQKSQKSTESPAGGAYSPQTSWLDFGGERKERAEKREDGGKRRGWLGKENRIGKGMERSKEGEGRVPSLAWPPPFNIVGPHCRVVIFSWWTGWGQSFFYGRVCLYLYRPICVAV